MDNIPNGAGDGTDKMHTDGFDRDDPDWYIMQLAHERGLDLSTGTEDSAKVGI